MLCFGARGGLPLRYVRDLRPLTAIPLDAIVASLHTPPHSRTKSLPGVPPPPYKRGALRGTPRCALRTVLSRHGSRARSGKRTTQGGPRSGGRSCGTGGDPALVEGKITLLTMDTEKNWKMIAGRVRWMKPGSRDRMRPGTPPAEKLPLAGMREGG